MVGWLRIWVIALSLVTASVASTSSQPAMSPDAILTKLTEGNARFAKGEPVHPDADAHRRAETVDNGQHPYVTVVSCSDSRVPVELLFDQGVGDIFVIRVAGNVCDVDEIGSIEYGVDHLGTPLLVVLGHSACGAVTAVVTGAEVHGNIPPLVENIKPAFQTAQKEHPDLHGKDLVPAAIRANVWQGIEDLLRVSPTTCDLVRAGKLQIVGALYDLRSGKVEWMGRHPHESELLSHATAAPHGPTAGHGVKHPASAPAGTAAHASGHAAAGAQASSHETGASTAQTGSAVAQSSHAAPVRTEVEAQPVTLVVPAKLASLDDARHRRPGKAAAVQAGEETGMSMVWKIAIAFAAIAVLSAVGYRSGLLSGMGIAGKLYAGFAAVAVLAIGMGYVSYHSLSLVSVEDHCALSAADLALKSTEAGEHQNEFLLVGMEDKARAEEILREHEATVKSIHEGFATLRACDPDGVQVRVIQTIEEAAGKYDKSFAEIVQRFHELEQESEALSQAGDRMEAVLAGVVAEHEADLREMQQSGADAQTLHYASELIESLAAAELLVANIARHETEFLLEKRLDTVASLEKEIGSLQAQFARVKELIPKAAKDKTEEQHDLAEIAKVTGELDAYQKALGQAIENELVVEATLVDCRQDLQALATNTEAFARHVETKAEQVKAEANTTTIGLLITVAGLSAVLALLIVRAITRPVKRIIDGLSDGSHQVEEAARQVASASQQLAEGATEQASSLEETSSAMEQMAAITQTNASNCKEATQLVGQVRDNARTGDATVLKLNDAMAAINSSSEKINKIIKVIEEIAFQTNLLALNAAVEAARAGEHGKGFAVVADEVRNLAQRAAQAARETTDLIASAVDNARGGSQVAADVAHALNSILADVEKTSDLVQGISKASDEQAQGVGQINTAVAQMDKVTQSTAAGAEESAAASEELAGQAQALQGMVFDLVALVSGRSAAQAPAGTTAADQPR